MTEDLKQELTDIVQGGQALSNPRSTSDGILLQWQTERRWGHMDYAIVQHGGKIYEVGLRYHSEEGLVDGYSTFKVMDRAAITCPTCKKGL